MRIAIAIFDGFDELDAVGPWEVFRVAARLGAGVDAELATLGGPRRVRASHGLALESTAALEDGPWGWIVVAGGNWMKPDLAGARAEAERGDLPRAIVAARELGANVASVCTGAMLLARAGLLTGRRATTHAVAKSDLAAAGAAVVDARVVDDGDVVTAGGVTSGIDLALHLVARIAGAPAANAVARHVEYAWEA